MAAPSMRATWEGSLSVGNLHIPVQLFNAIQDYRPKMSMVDRNSLSAIGNQRVAKETGEAVSQDNLAFGFKFDGQMIAFSREEIRASLPRSTQTCSVEMFVAASEITPALFNKPYHVKPLKEGRKAYALLRDTLEKSHRVGIARIVLATRQHLAALMPSGGVLLLVLLRWGSELRLAPPDLLDLNAEASADEIRYAEHLVKQLAGHFRPEAYEDTFTPKVHEAAQRKLQGGGAVFMTPLPGEVVQLPAVGTSVVEALRTSLKSVPPRPGKSAAAPAKAANDPMAARRAAAKKGGIKHAIATAKSPAKKAAAVAKAKAPMPGASSATKKAAGPAKPASARTGKSAPPKGAAPRKRPAGKIAPGAQPTKTAKKAPKGRG